MSASGTPSALIRAIKLAALPARSACAADAVEPLDSMAASTTARSGFRDTIASPLVRIAGAIVEVDVDSVGVLVRTIGRPNVTTSAATTTEQAAAMPSDTRLIRISPPNAPAEPEVTHTRCDVRSGLDQRCKAAVGPGFMAARPYEPRPSRRSWAAGCRRHRFPRRAGGTPVRP